MSPLAAALLLSAAGLAWAGPEFSADELQARYYYDLGPAEVDASSYPESLERGRRLFQLICTQCHGAARALNSPLAARADWKRYVTRMSLKDQARIQVGFTKEEGAALVDFLTYDSKVRKLDRRAAFEAATRELQARFERARRERARLQLEADEKKARRREQGRRPGL